MNLVLTFDTILFFTGAAFELNDLIIMLKNPFTIRCKAMNRG